MRKYVSIVALAIATVSTPAWAQTAPTVSDAEAFIAKAEKDLYDFTVESGRVQWVNATYITDDTDALAFSVLYRCLLARNRPAFGQQSNANPGWRYLNFT